MAGDPPKLDQAKLAKMQQSVRTGEFSFFEEDMFLLTRWILPIKTAGLIFEILII